VDVTIEPEDTNCPCCRAPMHVIGEETSQRLDVIPVQFRVIVTHRPKYACRVCAQAVVQAPAQERLIKGGLPTEAMVAHVLVAKYAWHLPLYRQAQMLLAQGLDIKRAILAFWVGYAVCGLTRLAKKQGVRLRQLYVRLAKRAAMMAGSYAHAKQFNRQRRQLRILRTRLGRLIRDIRRRSQATRSSRRHSPGHSHVPIRSARSSSASAAGSFIPFTLRKWDDVGGIAGATLR
jgi:transposase